jgi:hypothetical protein
MLNRSLVSGTTLSKSLEEELRRIWVITQNHYVVIPKTGKEDDLSCSNRLSDKDIRWRRFTSEVFPWKSQTNVLDAKSNDPKAKALGYPWGPGPAHGEARPVEELARAVILTGWNA